MTIYFAVYLSQSFWPANLEGSFEISTSLNLQSHQMERSTSETKYKLVEKVNVGITTFFEASDPFIGLQLDTLIVYLLTS
jgi:hypothetical protein